MQTEKRNEFSRIKDALNNITEVPGLELAPPSWEKMQLYLKASRKHRLATRWKFAAAACVAGLLLFGLLRK